MNLWLINTSENFVNEARKPIIDKLHLQVNVNKPHLNELNCKECYINIKYTIRKLVKKATILSEERRK